MPAILQNIFDDYALKSANLTGAYDRDTEDHQNSCQHGSLIP